MRVGFAFRFVHRIRHRGLMKLWTTMACIFHCFRCVILTIGVTLIVQGSPSNAAAQTRYAIYTMDLDSGDLKKIAEVKNNRSQSWPRWSPDGREIVFDGVVRNPDVQIYKTPADGR